MAVVREIIDILVCRKIHGCGCVGPSLTWKKSHQLIVGFKCSKDANTNCIIFKEDGSHQVNVASEYGVDYDGNNPLQRLILPLMLTPEAAMQLAVMNYF